MSINYGGANILCGQPNLMIVNMNPYKSKHCNTPWPQVKPKKQNYV